MWSEGCTKTIPQVHTALLLFGGHGPVPWGAVRRWGQQDLSRLCYLSLPLTRLLTSLDLEAVLPVSAAVTTDVVLATPQLSARVELLLRVLSILLPHILSLQREQQANPCWWTLVYSSGCEAIEGSLHPELILTKHTKELEERRLMP